MAELDENAQRFQAVITDINMGAGQNGWTLGIMPANSVTDASGPPMCSDAQ